MTRRILFLSGHYFCSLIWSLIFLSLFFLCSTPADARQAIEKKTIVLLETMPVHIVLEISDRLIEEMAKLGLVDGESIELIRYNAEGDREKARNFLHSILSVKTPDIVITNATLASQEAKSILNNTNIPQLFITVGAPVSAGLVSRIGVPTGTNLTGSLNSLAQETKIKNVMRLLSQIKGEQPLKFGIIHTTYPSSVGDTEALIEMAKERDDLQFITYPIEYRTIPEYTKDLLSEVQRGVRALEDQVDFWWQVADPINEMPEFNRILQQFSAHPIAFSVTVEGVSNHNALLFMRPDLAAYGRETAAIVSIILDGTSPGTIPVDYPKNYLLALNLSTALKLNIVVPSDMLSLAGRQTYLQE
jgi:putative ABC transport system substrate-binding protein